MSALDRVLSAAVVAGAACGLVSVVVAVQLPPARPCVPVVAVDYRGDLGAWVDAGGSVVLWAPAEDSFGWCA